MLEQEEQINEVQMHTRAAKTNAVLAAMELSNFCNLDVLVVIRDRHATATSSCAVMQYSSGGHSGLELFTIDQAAIAVK